ncbi:hypothetical protein C8P66_111144 [Humitalea rosea]|uniref:Uncharacterized protein n=1 Tax=Humitalea rosea TaxID=990373 RepID=A0A2W7IFP1_9PROT|nr:hypothetical protein [Humitalea rosea]PZW45728.1 hypothetical protein C8P66_111144 [Humitalea rosea]
MIQNLPSRSLREDEVWAVFASFGRKHRVAAIHPTRAAAEADRAWRDSQVQAYTGFLRSLEQPVPVYSVTTVRRAELPKGWAPLPALGFLRGKMA